LLFSNKFILALPLPYIGNRSFQKESVMKSRFLLSVMCFYLAAISLAAPASAGEFAAVHPDSAGCGELLWRSEHGFVPLPLVATNVTIDVTGPLIKGTIGQEFTNPTNETIEALYIFPMPDGAAVDAMELIVGERRIVSIVQEKAEARQTYEKAKAEGKKAALVESMRANLFTMSVAGIEPGQSVKVMLQYLDQAEFSGGSFQLAFPLTFTPRYFPPALMQSDRNDEYGNPGEDSNIITAPFVPDGHPMVPKATITVNLAAGFPLSSINSASHIITRRQNNQLVCITPSAGTIPADRDFLLSWTPRQGTEPLAALFTETREDGRYGFLMVVPGSDTEPAAAAIPTETLFLIDVSGSMSGASIRQARQALRQAVDRLGPGDSFNLMSFSNDSNLWRGSFQGVNDENLKDARHWIAGLEATGGTEMHGALLRAMTQFLKPVQEADTISRRIILMTDASIGNEAQLLRDTANNLGQVRLHVVGIGSSPNRFLVKRLASQGGGLSAFVNESAGAGQGMDKFLSTISRPLISNPQLSWHGAQPLESFPTRIPELYAGELVLWSGKFPLSDKISGLFAAEIDGSTWEISLDEDGDPQGQGSVAVRWGRMKVAERMAKLYSGGNRDQIRQDIIATALEFGLVTRFTSRVAVEEVVTTDGLYDPHKLANALPHGSNMLPQGGTIAPLLRLCGWLTLAMGLAMAGNHMRRTKGAKS
jgi:Ca-activated chloride channel homolog